MMPVFSGPPQVCAVEARGGDAVGADDGAVEVQVCQPGRLSLVEVAVCGGNRHPIVAGELSQAGAVEEPAQDEHGLFEAAQRTPPLAGSGRDPVIAQQPGVRRR
jgi:hypothetical protein